MSKRSVPILLADILESARKIEAYTQGYSFEQFEADSKTVDAVVRNFEIIGEAANQLPGEFKDMHAEIDWFRIRGFRNRIVHDYAGIDLSIIWQIREHFLPKMITMLKALL
jgi:uncharacterized protein with HEPN domain